MPSCTPAIVPASASASALALLLVACGTTPAPPPAAPLDSEAAAPVPHASDLAAGILARNDRLAIYVAAAGETQASIAEQHLGNAGRAWEIAALNGSSGVQPGLPLVLPLAPVNPGGVQPDRYQTVPILCYHRVGPGANRMFVSTGNFAQQLDWLAGNGYTVVALKDLVGFLEGRQALPPRAVVLSFDDGYESVYRHAYPLLLKHHMPATMFLYTDFIGTGSALSWPQAQEMLASGLVDIQAHSKTHANLIERLQDESDSAYRQRLEAEARLPRELIERRLPQHQVQHFAYPYGDANEVVLAVMVRQRYRLAVTVNPGGNPFHAQPLMLRRTMIFGSHDLEAFKAKLQTSRPIEAP